MPSNFAEATSDSTLSTYISSKVFFRIKATSWVGPGPCQTSGVYMGINLVLAEKPRSRTLWVSGRLNSAMLKTFIFFKGRHVPSR